MTPQCLSASLSPYRASTPAADRAVGAVMAAIDSLAAADRLLALRSIACLVGSRRAATVLAARNQGMSWAEIADRLGMSRQAVWHRFGPEEADQPPSDATHSPAVLDPAPLLQLRLVQGRDHPSRRGDPPMMLSVSDASFASEVLASPIPVLVEFGASWCPPCRAMAPVLADVARERADRLRVVSIDWDANRTVADSLAVMAVPTFFLFVGGDVALRFVGYTAKPKLLRIVDEALAEVATPAR